MVVMVEIVQEILRVGSVDIDDVLFNVIGAIIGYGMIKIPFVFKFFKIINLIKEENRLSEE